MRPDLDLPRVVCEYEDVFPEELPGLPPQRVIVRPEKIPIFLKKGKIIISVKIQNFSRSRMTKRISPLEASREI